MWGSTSLYLQIWPRYDLSKYQNQASMVKIVVKCVALKKMTTLRKIGITLLIANLQSQFFNMLCIKDRATIVISKIYLGTVEKVPKN